MTPRRGWSQANRCRPRRSLLSSAPSSLRKRSGDGVNDTTWGSNMEGLLAICDAEGVKVSYQPLAPDRGLLGMYIREGRRAGIILDESLSSQPRLERTVMAEEVGHHF